MDFVSFLKTRTIFWGHTVKGLAYRDRGIFQRGGLRETRAEAVDKVKRQRCNRKLFKFPYSILNTQIHKFDSFYPKPFIEINKLTILAKIMATEKFCMLWEQELFSPCVR